MQSLRVTIDSLKNCEVVADPDTLCLQKGINVLSQTVIRILSSNCDL